MVGLNSGRMLGLGLGGTSPSLAVLYGGRTGGAKVCTGAASAGADTARPSSDDLPRGDGDDAFGVENDFA